MGRGKGYTVAEDYFGKFTPLVSGSQGGYYRRKLKQKFQEEEPEGEGCERKPRSSIAQGKPYKYTKSCESIRAKIAKA